MLKKVLLNQISHQDDKDFIYFHNFQIGKKSQIQALNPQNGKRFYFD